MVIITINKQSESWKSSWKCSQGVCLMRTANLQCKLKKEESSENVSNLNKKTEFESSNQP